MNKLFIMSIFLFSSCPFAVFASEYSINLDKEIDMIQEAQEVYDTFSSSLKNNKDKLNQQQYNNSVEKLRQALKFPKEQKARVRSNGDVKRVDHEYHKEPLTANYDLLWFELHDLSKEGKYGKTIQEVLKITPYSFTELQNDINNN